MRFLKMFRATRFLTLIMLALTLGGTALGAMPREAAGQSAWDPRDDPNCVGTDTEVVCRELLGSVTYDSVRITTEACDLGWSHRKAIREITTTKVLRRDSYWVRYWAFGSSWTLTHEALEHEQTVLSENVDVSDCRPVTGKPPQN